MTSTASAVREHGTGERDDVHVPVHEPRPLDAQHVVISLPDHARRRPTRRTSRSKPVPGHRHSDLRQHGRLRDRHGHRRGRRGRHDHRGHSCPCEPGPGHTRLSDRDRSSWSRAPRRSPAHDHPGPAANVKNVLSPNVTSPRWPVRPATVRHPRHGQRNPHLGNPADNGGQTIQNFLITVTPPADRPHAPDRSLNAAPTSKCGAVNASDCYQLR